jgi:hypothetical protein
MAGEGGMGEYKKVVDLWNAIQQPNFDPSKLSAPELKMVAQMAPEVYDAKVPAELKTAQDSPEMRQQLGNSVAAYNDIAQNGMPVEQRLAAQEAQDATRQAYRQGIEASMQDLRSRGMAGSGAETALRLGAGQQAANMGAQQSSDLTRQAIAERLQALKSGSDLAAQTRGQDVALSQSQADDYNAFHRFVSEMDTQAARDAAASRAQAQQYNVGTQQNLANQNSLNKYQVAEGNLNRWNQLQQQQYGNQLEKVQGQSNAYNTLGFAKDAEKVGKIKAAAGIGQGVGSLGDSVLDLGKDKNGSGGLIAGLI